MDRKRLVKAILASRGIDESGPLLEANPSGVTHRTRFPPRLIAGFQEVTADPGKTSAHGPIGDTLDFECLSLEIRRRALDIPVDEFPVDFPWRQTDAPMAIIAGELLVEAIREAADRIARYESSPASQGMPTRPPTAGLQLIGFKIAGDVDLTGLKLPFAIRLVCCWVTGAISVNRARLGTLDVSGCVIERGICGAHSQIDGAVRFRRTVSLGPLDFGAATVEGVVDGSDAILIPRNSPPDFESYVGDRSQLNLALSKLRREVRLNRLRLYGGANMRDCEIGASLFLNDAILRAPIAVLEKEAYETLRDAAGKLPEEVPPMYAAAVSSERDLAAYLIWARFSGRVNKLLTDIELLSRYSILGPDKSSIPLTLERQLSKSVSARTSALRAEHANIHGSIFARSARVSGRLKLRGIRVEGGVILNGIRLRTIHSLSKSFDWLQHWMTRNTRIDLRVETVLGARNTTRNAVRSLEPKERDEHVLDLKNARIGGALDLSFDRRNIHRPQSERELIRQVCTVLCGQKEDPVKFAQLFHAPKKEDERLETSVLYNRLNELFEAAYKDTDKRSSPEKHERPISAPSPDIVSAICEEHGHISSALLIGEICLSKAVIGTDFRAEGLIANISGPGSARISLEINNCSIGGDVDLRNSVGLRCINARGIQIGGSLHMANRPRYDVSRDRWEPMRGRALFVAGSYPGDPHSVSARELYHQHDFEGARIGGSATFVFDREQGPRINLASARVGKKLIILPALAGLELSDREFESDRYLAQLVRARKRLKAPHTYNRKRGFLVRRRLEEPLPKKMSDEEVDRVLYPINVPSIDLRQAEVSTLAHPSSAWPQQDGLIVEGLRYQYCSEYGPLAPKRRTRKDMDDDGGVNADRRDKLFGSLSFALLFGTPVAILFYAARPWEVVGYVNLSVLVVCASAMLYARWARAFTRPTPHDGEPRALYWLLLQRSRPNVQKERGVIRPFEPYMQAASVLRAAGQLGSANAVELERLRLRRRALTNRYYFTARAFLAMADLVAKYGLGTTRAAAIAVFLTSIGGMIYHQADQCAMVLPADAPLAYAAGMLKPVAADKLRETPPHDSGYAASAPALYPSFVSLLYSIDVVIPFLDLEQQKNWNVAAKGQAGEIRSGCIIPSKGWGRSVALWIAGILTPLATVLGWLLTTIMAIALVARVETILAREED